MGNRRCPAAARAAAPLRFGHGAERPHPSDRAEGGGQCDVPHRALDRVSAAGCGRGGRPWAAQSTCGAAAQHAGRHQRVGGEAPERSAAQRHHDCRGGNGMSLRELLLPYLSALLLAALTPCVSHAGVTSAASTIVIAKDFMFGPTALTVAAGSTVTWTNKDDEPHTVVSDSGLFRSAALSPRPFATPAPFTRAWSAPLWCRRLLICACTTWRCLVHVSHPVTFCR